MSKSGGVFQIDDVTRTMSKGGGGAPGVPPIQVQTPPPPTWLVGYGPGPRMYSFIPRDLKSGIFFIKFPSGGI